MVTSQIEKGTWFDYIGVDALYGADQGFTDSLDQMALTFVGDIRSNQKVYLEEPGIEIPTRKSNRGRKPSNLKADIKPVKVNDYIKRLNSSDFEEIKVRNTAKGHYN